MRTYIITSTMWDYEACTEEPMEIVLVTQDREKAREFYREHHTVGDMGALELHIWENGRELEVDSDYADFRSEGA